MLGGILRFEWRYHTRRATFAASALALAGMALTFVATGYGPDGVDVDAPMVVMQSLGLLSLFSVFVLTFFCAGAALRDAEHGMTELVFSRPVGKARYLGGRFGGALLVAVAAMAIAALVSMVAPLVVHVEPTRLGAVRPLAYLWALGVIVVPNLLLVGALLFAVATLTRSTLATYVGAVAIYALYLVAALLIDSPLMAGTAPPTPEGLARAALLDPFGLSAFFEQTRYWTPAERDVRVPALTGHLLTNRLLWLGVALGVLALTYWRFSFRVDGRSRTKRTPPLAAREVTGGIHIYRPVSPAIDGTFWPALGAATRAEVRHVLRGWTFAALLALWAFVAGMESVAQLGGGEYGSHVLPTTGLLVDAMQLPLLLLGTITLVYYAAEVAWRERIVGVDPLVDATPASNAVLLLAKGAALCALPAIMTVVAIVVGIGVQLARGYGHIELGLWLSLFWYAGAPLALVAVGALAMQAVASNRWIGMLAGLALALVARRGETIGLEHPMLRYGAVPNVSHSDLDGFGPAATSFAAFIGYWSVAAALLACVSWGVWRRGIDPGVRARLVGVPRAWGRRGQLGAAACAVAFVVAAIALFSRTNVSHAWEGSGARESWAVDYERAYRRIADRAQPSIVAVRTRVDLYPDERRAEVAATLTLENRASVNVDTVWVVMPRGVTNARVTMDDATLVQHDARFGVWTFAPTHALAPGARGTLRLSSTLDRGGVRAAGFAYDVAENGTLLMNRDAYPTLGYRAGWELDDPARRKSSGLVAPPSTLPSLAAVDSLRALGQAHAAWITLDATVTTAADQTALAPGRLVATETHGDRRSFRYVSEGEMTPLFGIVSARYAVRRVRHDGVDVEVWYDAAHARNVDRALGAAVRALDVLGRRYGRYPHATLRIAEVPAWSGFGAFAVSGMIFFPEDRGFLADPRADSLPRAARGVDLIGRRVAHEVAHQWWGHRLDPADVAGASTLVETLAKQSEQLVVASLHGERALPAMLVFDEDRYLAGRAGAVHGERTLMEIAGESWLYYGKGAIAMHALRDRLGGDAVDRALAGLIATHGGPRGDATTNDLRDALRAATRDDDQRAFVDEWLGGRVLYDLRVDSATAIPLGGGRFPVQASIAAAKSGGRPIDGESLDVAVYDDRDGVLYVGARPVSSGRIALGVDVGARPAYVVVDPKVTHIDRDRSDDRKRLEVP